MKENKTTYFFVRHGQTDWNVQGKIQGHTDISLNDRGRQQAAALKRLLRDIHFSACFSSDLQRAAETASIVVEGRFLEIVKEDTLRERHYGDFQGKLSEEYEASTVEQRASIESNESLRKRIETFLADKAQHPIEHQGNILIVTHGGFMFGVLALVLNLPFDLENDVVIDNTAYVQMYFSGSKWVIEKTEGITLPKAQ